MKTAKKVLMGLLCFGVIGFTACNNDDDDGGSPEPEAQGTFTGDFTDLYTNLGETTEWNAVSASAEHDTLTDEVTITAVGEGGDTIVILIDDTAAVPTPYYMGQYSSNYTTYSTSALAEPATSLTDDQPDQQSSIFITHSGVNDDILEGEINILKWYVVDPDEEDESFGQITGGNFSVPITRTGMDLQPSGETSLSATIDGATFGPAPEQINSFNVQGAITITGVMGTQTLGLTIPSSATTGDHDLAGFSQYSIIYSADGSSYSPESGTLTITALDSDAGTVTGEFSCTVANTTDPTDTKEITNGLFSIQ